MTRERIFAKNSQIRNPDPRVTLLLSLGFLFFLLNLLTFFIDSKPSPYPENVKSLTLDMSGLTLRLKLIDNHQDTAGMVINYTPFFFEPVPVNHASKVMLTTIPGIGDVLAEIH